MPSTTPIELTLPATGARIAGLHRPGPGPRVLALHGWLDNVLTWAPAFEALDGLDLVCIDFPGHGESPPRPHAARYHFDDYVFDVLGALDALGWDQAHLLGHSLGGAVASVTAAACPARVRTLNVVEGLGPLSAPSTRTAANWRHALARQRPRPRRIHPDRAAAIGARVHDSDLPVEAAERLAERGLTEVDGGWQWRHDQRLTWPSTQRYTEPQVLDLLAAIEAPTLCVLATPRSRLLPDGLMERRAAAVRCLERVDVEGGHHVHMQAAEPVSRRIKDHIHAHEHLRD
ncbi:alpha/beta hydrolase [Wenzhouxiangella sp. XN79A]|uniref:alpha/beta fold hydrolase n=1 Tax=Wenzhouxiangella sp. XN79A TaxID=2724193 RepID=UPI00144ADF6A|nr:alpha/beta hydrolase [Wenzhouxiangella sp. XN79A]NKI33882.1 alpha/beta hydrolase [Wenzhouxiangella sp. XN79A]